MKIDLSIEVDTKGYEVNNLVDLNQFPRSIKVIIVFNILKGIAKYLSEKGVALDIVASAAESVGQFCHGVRYGKHNWDGDYFYRDA
jgi:hypothetical protein